MYHPTPPSMRPGETAGQRGAAVLAYILQHGTAPFELEDLYRADRAALIGAIAPDLLETTRDRINATRHDIARAVRLRFTEQTQPAPVAARPPAQAPTGGQAVRPLAPLPTRPTPARALEIDVF